jgi:hypothetical protein
MKPVVGPGLPPSVKDPASFLTDDCIRVGNPRDERCRKFLTALNPHHHSYGILIIRWDRCARRGSLEAHVRWSEGEFPTTAKLTNKPNFLGRPTRVSDPQFHRNEANFAGDGSAKRSQFVQKPRRRTKPIRCPTRVSDPQSRVSDPQFHRTKPISWGMNLRNEANLPGRNRVLFVPELLCSAGLVRSSYETKPIQRLDEQVWKEWDRPTEYREPVPVSVPNEANSAQLRISSFGILGVLMFRMLIRAAKIFRRP